MLTLNQKKSIVECDTYFQVPRDNIPSTLPKHLTLVQNTAQAIKQECFFLPTQGANFWSETYSDLLYIVFSVHPTEVGFPTADPATYQKVRENGFNPGNQLNV